jgi:hypothetical protein
VAIVRPAWDDRAAAGKAGASFQAAIIKGSSTDDLTDNANRLPQECVKTSPRTGTVSPWILSAHPA